MVSPPILPSVRKNILNIRLPSESCLDNPGLQRVNWFGCDHLETEVGGMNLKGKIITILWNKLAFSSGFLMVKVRVFFMDLFCI